MWLCNVGRLQVSSWYHVEMERRLHRTHGWQGCMSCSIGMFRVVGFIGLAFRCVHMAISADVVQNDRFLRFVDTKCGAIENTNVKP